MNTFFVWKFCQFEILIFQILLTVTLVILASQESLSSNYNAEYIGFYNNVFSAGTDSLWEQSNKQKQGVYSSLGHPVEAGNDRKKLTEALSMLLNTHTNVQPLNVHPNRLLTWFYI